MNLSRTLSTSVIALALSVPLVLMARSGDGLPATSRVDQATTSKLVYGPLSDSRYAYRPRPLDGTLSADIFERYLDSLDGSRSEEHTSELQSLMRISYAVFCLTKNN